MSYQQVKRFKSYFEGIAQHLDCPVCLDFVKPPVKQCINGHICCFTCGINLRNCPTCRGRFTQTNSLINDIVYSFVKRCPFRLYGCHEILSPTEYDDHVENCSSRQILCKICYQNVYAQHFWNHVYLKHEEKTWMGESNVLYWNKFNFKKNLQNIEIIKAFDELFWYCFSYNVIDSSFNIVVQFIGPKLQAEKYIYEVSTGAHSVSENRLMFKRTTHHYMDSVKYNFQTDGISIKENFIISVIQNDSFFLHLNLYKKNEEPKRKETRNVRTLLSGS